jgi:hypothetical protein
MLDCRTVRLWLANEEPGAADTNLMVLVWSPLEPRSLFELKPQLGPPDLLNSLI